MSVILHRRQLIEALFLAPATRALARAEGAGWDGMAAVLARIQAPVFPARDFPITRYGAVEGGADICTAAIAKAVAACAAAGGGRVVVPPGVYLTGPVHLRSGVNLHVAQGATLKFSTNPAHYLPAVFTRWEGMECMNYSPFIYAFEQRNIAVTGEGTLDGQAGLSNWWPWKARTEYGWKKGDPGQVKARAQLIEMTAQGVAPEKRVFGDGSFLRPQFIQPYRCENVLIQGVTIVNSPMWEIHPALCRNVTVRGVKVASHGPNNDGCNPESSTDVLIEGCRFDTGDDCIAIKSGRNEDGRRLKVPSENIIVRRCEMKDGHGGVTIGSEISGGCRNVWVEDCRMDSPHLDRVLRLKTNAARGGLIERVYMRNVTVGQVADAAVHVDFFYEEGEKGDYPPTVRHIEVERLTCRKLKSALYVRGFRNAPVRDILLKDCVFESASAEDTLENVEGLRMVNVTVNGKTVSR
jgi:polygalacturonase